MDSRGGVYLPRYAWEEIHDPVGNFSLFDEDGEGEYISVSDDMLKLLFKNYSEDAKLTFLNNRSQRIALDTLLLADVLLATGGEKFGESNQYIPTGSLVAFQYKSGAESSIVYRLKANGDYVKTDCQSIDDCSLAEESNPVVIFKLDSTTSASPIVGRVAKNEEEFVLVVSQVDDITTGGNLSYDGYLDYFFEFQPTVGENGNFRHLGETFSTNAQGIVLSQEFHYPMYQSFADRYPGDLQFSEFIQFLHRKHGAADV